MIFSFNIDNIIYKIDSRNRLDIAISLKFDGAQPNAYGVESATATACEAGAIIGDTRRGGSCNFEQIKFIPHCNGTHTESIGHITRERISIHDCLRDAFVPAFLVSVQPVSATDTAETYSVELNREDLLITRQSLETALANADGNFLQGLIVRTLPNDESKLTMNYGERLPPFFSTEAMQLMAEKKVKHLLVDVPSIDRMFDEGKLSNHRAFWRVEPGSFDVNEASLIKNTITEMIFAPDSVADGAYLLNLQIAAFVSDASPSRPILFEIYE